MAGSLSRNRLKWLSNTGLLRSVRGPGLAAEPLLSMANSTRFSASLSATCPGYAPNANGTANILTILGAAMLAIVALLSPRLRRPERHSPPYNGPFRCRPIEPSQSAIDLRPVGGARFVQYRDAQSCVVSK